VWIASVANIDWPSKPGLPSAQQQAELIAMLDRAVQLKLNAIVLQVRPGGDALYNSPHEPWSEYLTGAMGKAPEPFYDPLEFAVTEAHRRGLELHAWFNPYRARHPSAQSPVSANHLSQTRPDIVHPYGRHLWMDPGERDVQDQTVRVIRDVVRRYDIDGVHIDDYFYPYRERDSLGVEIPFPDDASWGRYTASGGRLSRDDWRRRNVDQLVERLHREIKQEKSWVKFGISPFGIWRPGYPAEVTTTFDPYEQLYADALKWWTNGWMDYFTPQLYWPIARPDLSYPILLRWWAQQNRRGRHLWPGNFTSRVGYDTPRWRSDEVLGQVFVTRAQPGATGNVHFSMRVFMQNPDSLVEKLTRSAYAQPALVPASPWLRSRVPARPGVTLRADSVTLQPRGAAPWLWVVRARWSDGWSTEILPGWQRSHALVRTGATAPPSMVVVSAVDRAGNQSPVAVERLE
jgi:uncharacterized lipoprotein YddW (UPF0748 family)